MTVRANTLRSGLLTVLVVASVAGLASLPGGATLEETNVAEKPIVQQDTAVFDQRTVVEQRGDVARLTVLLDGTDRANVTIGSPDVNFEVSFTLVDADGDGEATVEINTAVAGLENDSSGLRALGEDEITNFERTTGPIPGPLDATLYELELSVNDQLTDVGVLVLNERSTGEMSVWSAPETAQPADARELIATITRSDEIRRGDRAVLAIRVSGVFGYVENASDLENSANGTNVSLVEEPGRNRPERAANLSDLSVVTDATNDTLFVLFDTENLTVGSEYTATFTIDDRNPYIETGETESASATFTVVERNATDANATEETVSVNATVTTNGEETTDETVTDDPATTDGETTEVGTTEDGLTEEVVRTTTEDSSSGLVTAGPSGNSIGLVAILVGVVLIVVRRT